MRTVHPSRLFVLTKDSTTLKDEQCIDTHHNKSHSHQNICALLTNPTATFGAARHSPNVQLHVTPAVVFIIIVVVVSIRLFSY